MLVPAITRTARGEISHAFESRLRQGKIQRRVKAADGGDRIRNEVTVIDVQKSVGQGGVRFAKTRDAVHAIRQDASLADSKFTPILRIGKDPLHDFGQAAGGFQHFKRVAMRLDYHRIGKTRSNGSRK